MFYAVQQSHILIMQRRRKEEIKGTGRKNKEEGNMWATTLTLDAQTKRGVARCHLSTAVSGAASVETGSCVRDGP